MHGYVASLCALVDKEALWSLWAGSQCEGAFLLALVPGKCRHFARAHDLPSHKTSIMLIVLLRDLSPSGYRLVMSTLAFSRLRRLSNQSVSVTKSRSLLSWRSHLDVWRDQIHKARPCALGSVALTSVIETGEREV